MWCDVIMDFFIFLFWIWPKRFQSHLFQEGCPLSQILHFLKGRRVLNIMVTYEAWLPERSDSCLHQNKARSCSNKCLAMEAIDCVLTGNFTLSSSLAAGAAYIKYCKGYPRWLLKPVYINICEEQHRHLPSSCHWLVRFLTLVRELSALWCGTLLTASGVRFMQEKDKYIWP